MKLNFVKVNESGLLENAWGWASSAIEGFTPETSEGTPVFCPGDIYFALDLVLPPRGLNTWQVRWMRESGVQIVFMVYDLLPLTHPQYFRLSGRMFFKWWSTGLQYADELVTISQFSKASIENLLNYSNRAKKPMVHITIAPLSGEAEKDEPEERTEAQELSHPGGKLFISLGTLEPRKGYKEVLEAFENVWKDGGNYSWWIFGSEGWKVKNFVWRITRHSEFGKKLRWYQNEPDSVVFQAIRIADALIFNSKAEGLGLPILEAQNQGLGVIARDTPVVRETLNEDGQLIGDGRRNTTELAAQIRRTGEMVTRETEILGKPRYETSWSETSSLLDKHFSAYLETS